MKSNPFFLSMCLYDLNTRHGKDDSDRKPIRLSENFYCDGNSKEVLDMLGEPRQAVDPVTASKSAVFWMSKKEKLADVALLIRIDKVLQGDLADAMEPYSKDADVSKLAAKQQQAMTACCKRLGDYRQPFAWTVVNLFNANGELESPGQPLDAKPLFRHDTDRVDDEHLLNKYISDIKKASTSKKIKTLQGAVTIRVTRLGTEEAIDGLVSASLAPVAPVTPMHQRTPTREIQDFLPAGAGMVDEMTNILYIYPNTVNFEKRGSKARNIAVTVEVLDQDLNPTSSPTPLKVIQGKSNTAALLTSATTGVSYHNNQPTFGDEIKVFLPVNLSSHHHLRFTFVHIKASPPKKNEKEANVATVVGYCILPVLDSTGKLLSDGAYEIPVASELPDNYLPACQIANGKHLDSTAGLVKWSDPKREVFKVSLAAISGVHPQDPYIYSFLVQTDHVMDGPGINSLAENEFNHLHAAVGSLLNAERNPSQVVRFLPVLLDRLVWVLCQKVERQALTKAAFRGLVWAVTLAVQLSDAKGSGSSLIDNYVRFNFRNPEGEHCVPAYKAIVCQFLCAMQDIQEYLGNLFQHCRVFFDMIHKSMVLHLADTGKLLNSSKRFERFDEEYLGDLGKMCLKMEESIRQKASSAYNQAKRLNENLALFLRSCFSCMDRGFVFFLVQRHVQSVSLSDSEVLLEFKFEFLWLVCSYEHYVALNLPFSDPAFLQNPSTATCDSTEYRESCILASLLLNEIAIVLGHSEKNLRMRAVHVLRDLLVKLNFDARYQDTVSKQRIAALHFPFVLLVLEHAGRLTTVDKAPEKMDKPKSKEKAGSGAPTADNFSYAESCELLLCFLHILRNLDPNLVERWWLSETGVHLCVLVDVLKATIVAFEYKGREEAFKKDASSKMGTINSTDAKRLLEEQYANLSQGGARAKLLARRGQAMDADRQSLDSSKTIGTLSWDSLGRHINTIGKAPADFQDVLEADMRYQQAFSVEVAMSVLDILQHLLAAFDSIEVEDFSKHKLTEMMFGLLLDLLSTHQSQRVMEHVFADVRLFVTKFPEVIFDGTTEECGSLCMELLRHTNSTHKSTRVGAAACLYLLMRANYEYTGESFARIKMQLTMALSKLMGSAVQANVAFLPRSLATVNAMAQMDPTTPQPFKQEAHNLACNLYMVLHDTLKMQEYANDPEMFVDLQFRIAKGYAHSPSLRLTWLENMEKYHAQKECWAERAMCTLHMCAIVAEYLVSIDYNDHLPSGASAFTRISANTIEEAALSLQDVSDDEFQSNTAIFSEGNLIKMMEKCVSDLRKAELYELVAEVYKILVPIYEKNRAWSYLQASYDHLATIYDTIIKVEKAKRRILGTYFRIRFFGRCFREMDGLEYVYKEPKVTPLAEISLRLETFYSAKFGQGKFEVIQESGDIEPDQLDPAKGYAQITFVEPYFDEFEDKNRITYFEKNTNIKKFVFETPFTLDGKAHGGLEAQHKRKTIITTEHHFPYVKKRVLVVSHEEIVLTPIEVAIEEVSRKCRELQAAVTTKPTNVKMLQLVLQGSVSAAVNAGPLAMAKAFLGPTAGQFEEQQRRKLRQTFRQFLELCGQAVDLNSQVALQDQQAYSADLQEKYGDLQLQFDPYLQTGKPSRTRTSRERANTAHYRKTMIAQLPEVGQFWEDGQGVEEPSDENHMGSSMSLANGDANNHNQ
eukprot:comp23911_c1_seq1/m.42132 comp23911_c1_seq1/g.42132  ORF comp23911_c1_seq1/g.42132 comp23911_c1_seq1/m.42132 type:complete len:1683 (-) comp23911_c1_seq1:637-5685(-)